MRSKPSIVGAPDWSSKDRFDIDAVPDVEGAPNPQQVRLMIRKLLTERFKLTFHRDKKELSAFVLTVGKAEKLAPTQMNGPLPGIGMRPATGGLTLMIRNGTAGDFTGFLQTLVLDRPVVDNTGLKGRFDFSVTFLPDDTQFNGHSPVGKLADGVEPAAGLTEALQQQLGLKLSAEKTPVEVLAIDHVEKPSANWPDQPVTSAAGYFARSARRRKLTSFTLHLTSLRAMTVRRGAFAAGVTRRFDEHCTLRHGRLNSFLETS